MSFPIQVSSPKRKRSTLRNLVAAVLAVNAAGANASSTTGGLPANLASWKGGFVTFNHSGVRSAAPGCQSSNLPKAWAVDIGNNAGQAVLATLLTAMALRKEVYIYGSAVCNVRADLETVELVEFVE